MLDLAASGGLEEIVRLLISAGADVNTKDEFGVAPLAGAARFGHTRIISRLLDAGAEIDATSQMGWTALMNAAYGGEADAARLLVDRGADVSISDGNHTAMNLAEWGRHKELAQILERSPSPQTRRTEEDKVQITPTDPHAIAAERQDRLKVLTKPVIIRRPQP